MDRARDKYPKTVSVLEGLTNERNTWRLMGKLYNDRLVTCQKDISDIPAPAKNSERQVIERLFQRNADVRQAWIVVDWLERNAQDQEADSLLNQMQYFSDSPVAWENTLSALQRGALGPNMVQVIFNSVHKKPHPSKFIVICIVLNLDTNAKMPNSKMSFFKIFCVNLTPLSRTSKN